MHRVILFITILAALTLIILSVAMHDYMIVQKVSNPDTRILNIINLTGDGNRTGIHAFAHDAKSASALNESENDGSIVRFPTKCLGSALCPDSYQYYPNSL